MGSLLAKIDIWNSALDMLKEMPVASTSDQSPVAAYLSRNYNQQRDYLLERANWKFAITRALIPASTQVPAWGWSYLYSLPTDCLKPLQPTYDGTFMGTPIPYEIESDANGVVSILMSVNAPLRLRYVRRVTNEGLFSNGFAELLATRLAGKMAHWMTGKATMADNLAREYKQVFDDVTHTEALTLSGGTYYDTDIADVHESFY